MHTLFSQKKYTPEYGELTPGTTVKIHQMIKEGEKTRIQIFEGMIIGRSGKKTIDATIKVRRIATGGIGMERIFPIFSPLIEKIEIVKRANKVRRAKLNYLKERIGDSMKMRETQIKKEVTIYSNTVPAKVEVKEGVKAETPAEEVKKEETKEQ